MIPREYKPRRAYEVMNEVLKRGDAEYLASLLSCSHQLVRAWCREHESESASSTGKFGPLDRLRTLISMIREDDGDVCRAYPIGQYIAGLMDGVFVPLPQAPVSVDSSVMKSISSILHESGETLEKFRVAWFEETPGEITEAEYLKLKQQIKSAIVALMSLDSFVENNAKKKNQW